MRRWNYRGIRHNNSNIVGLLYFAPKEVYAGSLCYFNISKHCAGISVQQVKEVVSPFSSFSLFIKIREGNEWKQTKLTQRLGKVAWLGKNGFNRMIFMLVLSHLVPIKVLQALEACFKAKKMLCGFSGHSSFPPRSTCKRKLGVLCPIWMYLIFNTPLKLHLSLPYKGTHSLVIACRAITLCYTTKLHHSIEFWFCVSDARN